MELNRDLYSDPAQCKVFSEGFLVSVYRSSPRDQNVSNKGAHLITPKHTVAAVDMVIIGFLINDKTSQKLQQWYDCKRATGAAVILRGCQCCVRPWMCSGWGVMGGTTALLALCVSARCAACESRPLGAEKPRGGCKRKGLRVKGEVRWPTVACSGWRGRRTGHGNLISINLRCGCCLAAAGLRVILGGWVTSGGHLWPLE